MSLVSENGFKNEDFFSIDKRKVKKVVCKLCFYLKQSNYALKNVIYLPVVAENIYICVSYYIVTF